MRLRAQIAANTLAQLIGRGIGAVSALFITLLVARAFGAAAYGELTKILTFTAFFYLAADFGLNALTVKKLTAAQANGRIEPIQTLFAARIVLGILLTWLAAALTVFLPFSPVTGAGFSQTVKLGIILFAPTILLQALIRSTNAYFQSKLRYDQAALAAGLGSIGGLFLVGAVVYLRLASILFVLLALAVALFLQASVAIYLFKRRLCTPLRFTLQPANILSLLRQSSPLGLTLVLNAAFFRLDTFLLALLRAPEEVGRYGLAYKFFEFALTLPTFFMNAVYPLMTGLVAQTDRFQRLIKRAAGLLIVLSFALTGIFWLSAPYVKLIKNNFAAASQLLRILSLWFPFFFLSSLLMWILIAREAYWKLVGIYTTGLLGNAGLNLIFIPFYGAVAAAFTTGITELLILLLLLIAVKNSSAEQ